MNETAVIIKRQLLNELKFRLLHRQTVLLKLLGVDVVADDVKEIAPYVVDQQAQIELSQIKKALLRMQQDTYGQCVVCQKIINPSRLKAYPHSSFCCACSSP